MVPFGFPLINTLPKGGADFEGWIGFVGVEATKSSSFECKSSASHRPSRTDSADRDTHKDSLHPLVSQLLATHDSGASAATH